MRPQSTVVDSSITPPAMLEAVRSRLLHLLERDPVDSGQEFFRRVAETLSQACGARYALIACADARDPSALYTLGAAQHGQRVEDFSYRLAGGPCEQVFGRGLQHFPDELQSTFPGDADLEKMQARAYLGLPLYSRRAEPLGLIALLHDAPFEDPAFAVELLRQIAPHVGPALEREIKDRALRANEALLRGLMQHSPVAMAIVGFDPPHVFFELNAHLTQLLGYDAGVLRTLADWWPRAYPDAQYRNRALASWDATLRTLATAPTAQPPVTVAEVCCLDGSRREVEIHAGRYGDRVLLVLHDVGERRRLEGAFLEASQRERERLAIEVHDGLGQQLTGLSLLASGIAAQAARGTRIEAEALERLAAIAADAVTQCRAVSHGLMPLNEARGDLAGALRALAASVDVTGVHVECRVGQSGEMLLPPESRDHLYRIAQEALSNALRHARARNIEIRLVTTPLQVALEVRDDGQGWRPTLERSGLGLHTMRFRAAALRGRLTTESIEGGGTTVRCTCPNRRLSRAATPSR